MEEWEQSFPIYVEIGVQDVAFVITLLWVLSPLWTRYSFICSLFTEHYCVSDIADTIESKTDTALPSWCLH